MKKIIVFILLLSNIAFGQGGGSANADKSYLPNVTPPSPESFAITEYGKNGVSEYTGKLNLSIPIYNYTAGNLSLPISLNYSGAGVKVNDIATWTGINWNLSAGGVINRSVNDFPDESLSKTRIYIDRQNLLANADNTCAPNAQFYYNLSNFKDSYDTEVDIFNFSFNGFSGSFYFDENFAPIYIENENEIKIEIIGPSSSNAQNFRETKTFVITTPDGVKYFFGGNETESSQMFSGHRGGSLVSNSSFYLFKIEDPIKGTIILEYITGTPRQIYLSRNYSIRTNGLVNPQYSSAVTTLGVTNSISNPKRLYKIKSIENKVEVIFNSTLYANQHFLSTLDNIEVKNNLTLLKKIDFIYGAKITNNQQQNDFNTATRFFLEKIEIDKNFVLNKNETYLFEYDNPFGLPNRLSTSQDILGYFNGQNNLTLIPNSSHFNVNNSPNFANMDPDFSLAKRGSLKKVTYPTGGFSVFEYEPRPAKEKIFITYSTESSGVTVPGFNAYDDYVVFKPVYSTQKVNIYFNISFENESCRHGSHASLTITDVTPNLPTPIAPVTFGAGVLEYTFIKDHIYKIEQIAYPTQDCNIEANYFITLFDGYKIIDGLGVRLKKQKDFISNSASPSNQKRYYYNRITEFSGNVLKIKVIDYMPKYTFEYPGGGINDSPSSIPIESTNFAVITNIFSETRNKYTNLSNGEIYSIVTTSYGGDNFENGGTEKFFLSTDNSPINRIKVIYDGCWSQPEVEEGSFFINCGAPIVDLRNPISFIRENAMSFEETNFSQYNGKLLAERNYKNINGGLFKIDETINSFDFSILKSQATNFVGRTLFGYDIDQYCDENMYNNAVKPLSSCYIGYYDINSFYFKNISSITKQYIDPIPLSLYNPLIVFENEELFYDELPNVEELEAAYKKITTTQDYEYGTLRGLPTVVTTNTSDSAVVNKTLNTYVNTASSLPSIPSNQNAIYTSLISQNRVGSPIQTQQLQNAELLATQRTLFNNFTVNSITKILPEKIQISKAEQPLEDKAIFYNYDEHFNPVVMGYKDAPKTRYMFNTEGLVVAKIENYNGTATTFPLIVGNIDNSSCALQTEYPDANVTVFTYNLITKKLIQTTDSRCQNTFYEYDDLQRLKLIKDHDGNIVKEFDQQFKPQD